MVGDFNHWDGRYHPARSLGASGIWEPYSGVEEGAKYKYEISTRNGYPQLKTDPYGTRFEAPPYNASIVCKLDSMCGETRRSRTPCEHGQERANLDLRDARGFLIGRRRRAPPAEYRELASELVDYRRMNYTHVEFMPLEHPSMDHGTASDRFLCTDSALRHAGGFRIVDVLHQNGFGVIMDWVPAHFPTTVSRSQFDGSALYEHADPRQGFHQDWAH